MSWGLCDDIGRRDIVDILSHMFPIYIFIYVLTSTPAQTLNHASAFILRRSYLYFQKTREISYFYWLFCKSLFIENSRSSCHFTEVLLVILHFTKLSF